MTCRHIFQTFEWSAENSFNRVLKNKHQAVSQGVRRFGKRSILDDMRAFTIAAQRRITVSGAVFQHPVYCHPAMNPHFQIVP
jgi:hypothetical protein